MRVIDPADKVSINSSASRACARVKSIHTFFSVNAKGQSLQGRYPDDAMRDATHPCHQRSGISANLNPPLSDERSHQVAALVAAIHH